MAGMVRTNANLPLEVLAGEPDPEAALANLSGDASRIGPKPTPFRVRKPLLRVGLPFPVERDRLKRSPGHA
jgi:hypothetical protein